MFNNNEIPENNTPNTPIMDDKSFMERYNAMRQLEDAEKAKKLAEESLKQKQKAEEEERQRREMEATTYARQYQEQPRAIKDNLMEYSESIGVNRADTMKFAEQIVKKSGKSLEEVSKFLVENKKNSDLDAKVGTYDDVLNRFTSAIQSYSQTNTNPTPSQYPISQTPRYTQMGGDATLAVIEPQLNNLKEAHIQLNMVANTWEKDPIKGLAAMNSIKYAIDRAIYGVSQVNERESAQRRLDAQIARHRNQWGT